MAYLEVKNWTEFQHYKDRNPPWIKLHRAILDDYEFACLQDASKLHLILIWVLSSHSNGRIPNDPRYLKNKLGLDTEPDLQELVDKGFLVTVPTCSQDASSPQAKCSSEKRREDKKNTCAADDKSSTADAVPTCEKPLKTKPEKIAPNGVGWEHVTDEDRALWSSAYPAISIDQELAKALAWVRANPGNAKKNWRRFLTNWFTRAQERAPRTATAPTRPRITADI